MDLLALILSTQTDPAAVAELDRIADMLRLFALAMVAVAVFAAAVCAYTIYLLMSARRLVRDAEQKVKELAPRLAPTLNEARTSVQEFAWVARSLHQRVDAVGDTVDSVNEALRDAAHGVEVRAREFIAVLDVVREEAQELLLDTAATAHGVHAASAKLRARDRHPAIRPEPPPPIPEEAGRTSHGQG